MNISNKTNIHKPIPIKTQKHFYSKFFYTFIIAQALLLTILILFRGNLILSIISGVVFILLSSIFVYLISITTAKQLNILIKRLRDMWEFCDFSSPVPHIHSNDELGDLEQTIDGLQKSLECHANDLIRVLNGLSEYDLTVLIDCAYPGDYQKQKLALNKIILNFNHILEKISGSTTAIVNSMEYISSCASQVSMESMVQFDKVNALYENISSLHTRTQKNANLAKSSSSLAREAGVKMVEGNKELTSMRYIMEEINATSSEVESVIKTIDAISSRTKILALNASIEAARAGEAGRGFAIVAQEVSKLAAQTVAASQGTAALITASIKAVEKGLLSADNVASALDEVMAGAKAATEMMEEISFAAHEEEKYVENISNDISTVCNISEKNQAASQQGVTISLEVKEQAQALESIMHMFQYKQQTAH